MPFVSILVLMDLGLQPAEQIEGEIAHDFVSILVLMDLGLQPHKVGRFQ